MTIRLSLVVHLVGENLGKKTGRLDGFVQFAIAPFALVFEVFEALGLRHRLLAHVAFRATQVRAALTRGEAPLAGAS